MRNNVAIVTATIKKTALILKKMASTCAGRGVSILGARRYPRMGGLAGNTRCSRTRSQTTSGYVAANFVEPQQERDSIALRVPLSSWTFTVATRGLCI
jgi:hypothetical protein